MRDVRVFISSPGDAAFERQRTVRMLERLNGEFTSVARFIPIRWEDDLYKAHATFQAQIPEASKCDIVIAIFRQRLGTALPADFMAMTDNEPYPSGTAYEVLTAIAASQACGLPDVYVFRHPDSPSIKLDDPGRAEIEEQWRRLKIFFDTWFRTPEGQFKAAFQSFSTTDDFERPAEKALRKWIAEHLDQGRTWSIVQKGSPFRGLEPFGAKHTSVFFGRAREMAKAIDALKDAAGRGTPFLLLLGPSGAGKSSLARAGAVPRLTAPGAVADVDVWRVAVMRPGEGANPVAALAARLFDGPGDIKDEESGRPIALPELASGDFPSADKLAAAFAHDHESAMQPVLRALDKAGEAARQREGYDGPVNARLLIVADQLDDLFAANVSTEARAAFARLLARLAATGRIWIIGTLRDELYSVFQKETALRELREAGASLDVRAPGPAELAELVRGPAEAAGLIFEKEERTGETLDEVLLRDAERGELLPLLEFTLNRLFEARDSARLTFAAYAALGGIEGAVDKEAERALAALPQKAQARLGGLLRKLAAPSQTATGTVSLDIRPASLAEAEADEPSRQLVKALVGARILITSGTGHGHVRLAHARVLECWGRAKAIAADSAEFFRIRAEVEEQFRRWKAAKERRDLLITSGLPLAEAESIAKRFRDELTDGVRKFITLSSRRARAFQRRLAVAALLFLGLAIAATFFGIEARRTRNEAWLRESKYLADASKRETYAGDAVTGLLIALEALPDRRGDNEMALARPYWPSAEVSLERARHRARPELAILKGHEDQVWSAAFSPDGKLIVTASHDRTARLWDAQTGRQLGEPLAGHTEWVVSAAFSPDGRLIVTASNDRTARLWDAQTGRQIGEPLAGHSAPLTGAAFSPDGKRLVTTSWDSTARFWDVETRQPSGTPVLRHSNGVMKAAFSPDGRRIVTASWDKTAAIWNAQTAELIRELPRQKLEVITAVFSPDGSKILTGSLDHIARLWDAGTGELIGEFTGHEGGLWSAVYSKDGQRILTSSGDGTAQLWDARTRKPIGEPFAGHDDALASAVFSPDETKILTASLDRTARLWNAERKPAGEFINAHAVVRTAAYSPDGSRILTASDDNTARLWDAKTGEQIGEPLKGHDGPLWSAAFSPDGHRIVTASEDNTAQLWDADTHKPMGAPLAGHKGHVRYAVFSHDGRRIVTISGDATVLRWDAETLQTIGDPLMGHTATVYRAAFGPDDSEIVTASWDRTARIWDAKTGKPVGRPFVHRDDYEHASVGSAVFSPDGRRILTASADKKARLWDAGTGKPLGELTGHEGGVWGAAFSPDGRHIITASDDKTVRLWEVFPRRQNLIDDVKTFVPRCLTPRQRENFFLPREPPSWCIEMEKWPYRSAK
ncbi:MAG: AAA family ATPase [Rhodomicrobium sp.]